MPVAELRGPYESSEYLYVAMGFSNKLIIDGEKWYTDGYALITHDLTVKIVLRRYGVETKLTFEYEYTPNGWERKTN